MSASNGAAETDRRVAKARAIAKAEAIKRAVRNPKLSHGAARLFVLLTTYARWTESHGWLCWPGQRLLAKQMGAKWHSIPRWIVELESAGYLEVIRQPGTKSHYVLRVEPLPKETAAPLPEGTALPLPERTAGKNGRTAAHLDTTAAQRDSRTRSELVDRLSSFNKEASASSQSDSHSGDSDFSFEQDDPDQERPKRRLRLRRKHKAP